ncbi:MAG: methylated-DNA--[protein]-cysteine S-methyltransferase [Gammaproteobacteria bacterium]|nr:methylated-DNA--[protein]-cysteine S-methyltransferase [Gammaproteobacteria bacterium]
MPLPTSTSTEESARTLPDFYTRVWDVVRSIPRGRVASYGQVAELAGMPRGARQVGRALRLAPTSLPWHRVVTVSGRVAFPVQSDAYRRQCARLSEEDVPVIGGRIDMRRFRWQPTLDERLWGLR